MSGSREIIDMNLGPVESKRVSSASSVEGETTPDEKRGNLAILTEKKFYIDQVTVYQGDGFFLTVIQE